MRRSLCFICPTDGLECEVDHHLKGENYFYSSLGNSLILNESAIGQIKYLILEREISDVLFILREDNRIILDSVGGQDHADIINLKHLYLRMQRHKKQTGAFWKSSETVRVLLSWHLDMQIEALEAQLKDQIPWKIKFSGKICDIDGNRFNDIFSRLIFEPIRTLN